METVLVTGSTGQLGSELMKLFEDSRFELHGSYFETEPIVKGKYHKLDLGDREEVYETLKSILPDVIIHCAAMTNVDDCERRPELARKINFQGTESIVDYAIEMGCRIYYVSTDCVFDGEDGNYREEGKENPIQTYGETKLQGERTVSRLDEEAFCIIRTSVVFSSNSGNFVSWVIESLEAGEEIRVVGDQWVTPTYSVDLAEKICKLVTEQRFGVWNISCSDKISRLEMASIISNTLGLRGEGIKSVKLEDLDWLAKRPQDSTLNTDKIGRVSRTYTFEECLKRMVG